MINVGIVGNFLGEDIFKDKLEAQIIATITALKIKDLVDAVMQDYNEDTVNIVVTENSEFVDFMYDTFKEYGSVYNYQTRLIILSRNESALRKYIGYSSKILNKFDEIIYTDTKGSLYNGKLYSIKEREAKKEQYFVDTCDIIFHLWSGSMDEFNKYSRLIKGRRKKRFIIDAFSSEIIEVD